MLRRVSSDLSERPSGSCLKMVLWLIDEGVLEWSNTLGNNNCHSKGVIESRDVSESHDSWKSCITLALADVINGSSSSSRVDDKLGQLCGLLSDLSDAGSGILSYLDVHILEAVENSWEDFSLNNDLSKIDGVLGDLSKALTDISFELGIWVRDESSKIWDGSLINNGLGELLSVLGNLSKGSG